MKIGEKFRLIRKNLNQTQAVTARSLGIAADVLSRLETGSRVPDIEILQKFGNHFNISGNWLLFDETPIHRSPGEDRTIEELLLELTTALNQRREIKAPREEPDDESISLDLDTLGNDPKDLMPVFEYMLKDQKVSRGILQFFYMFIKPEADRRLAAARAAQGEED